VNARLSATLAVLLTTGFLAGCGSSGSSGQTSTAAGDQAAAGAAKPVHGAQAASSNAPVTSARPRSTGSNGAAAPKLPAPCSLISAAEASASLGYAVTSLDSSADNDPDQISCLYLKGKDPVMVVLIRQWTLDHFAQDAAKEPGHPQPLGGVGTSAYQGANDKGPVVLTWERGVSVLLNGVSPVSADEVKFLAKVAVGQLDSPK
jgi:hypothetical protein